MRSQSTIEAAEFLENVPETQCNREITKTSQSWSQKTSDKKPDILEEMKLKISPTQKTPKFDEKEVPEYHLNGNGQIDRTDSGHPRCNYCLIASHPRASCKIRQNDLNRNVDRAVPPLKGLLDEKGVSEYHLDNKGQVARTDSGRTLCNYCLNESHPRADCKIRQSNIFFGVDHPVPPLKEYLDKGGVPNYQLHILLMTLGYSRTNRTL